MSQPQEWEAIQWVADSIEEALMVVPHGPLSDTLIEALARIKDGAREAYGSNWRTLGLDLTISDPASEMLGPERLEDD